MHFLERILLGLVNLCFMLVPQRRPSQPALVDCKIIAHRGEHDNQQVLENTLDAFAAATEAGCWGLEFDVRWTRDLQPVVVHDADLQRVFDIDLEVAQVDLPELQRRAPQIPTLARVVEQFGGRQHLMVELKRDRLGEIETRKRILREIFASLEPARDFHILALDTELFDLVEFCARHACLPVAELNVGELSRTALSQGYAGVCAQYLLLSRRRIRKHHQQQQFVGSGFAASRYGLYREINRGVDWVFTNHAVKLETLRRRLLHGE